MTMKDNRRAPISLLRRSSLLLIRSSLSFKTRFSSLFCSSLYPQRNKLALSDGPFVAVRAGLVSGIRSDARSSFLRKCVFEVDIFKGWIKKE